MVHPFGGNTCISVFYSIPRSVNLVVTGAGVSPKVQQLKKKSEIHWHLGSLEIQGEYRSARLGPRANGQ